MDATTSGSPSVQFHAIAEQPIAASCVTSSSATMFDRQVRHCCLDPTPGEFPLASYPSLVVHVLTSCNVDPQDLARLEATCSFFRQPAQFAPNYDLSISELAALDMCNKRAIFRPMTTEQRDDLKRKCGDSWKLVLKYLLAGEAYCRREKSQVLAGPGHSVAVTSKGAVYSFGCNSSGQLGHGAIGDGSTINEYRPRLIRSLEGIRIIQAAVGTRKTMLISDAGKVYAFGDELSGEDEYGAQGSKVVHSPQLVESLKGMFVVQVAIAELFTAVLSREGRVYTLSWGADARLGHETDSTDMEPHPLLGLLENIPVAQIAAGHCYLLALAFQPSGMSVYSVGCGQGGKLGHGTETDEEYPRLIKHLHTLNLKPVVISAGAWHAAVIGEDGRVCTWGWGYNGCLGHGNGDFVTLPKVVEGLNNVKAVHIATGHYTTFVISDTGDVYSFGSGVSWSLGHNNEADEQVNRQTNFLAPRLVTSLKQVNEEVVQISLTNSYGSAHTLVLTESGKLYAFGSCGKGQLGVKIRDNRVRRGKPERVDIDLNT
ncbi:hypothetical protein Dimus_031938 [Dionaea muscipula]